MFEYVLLNRKGFHPWVHVPNATDRRPRRIEIAFVSFLQTSCVVLDSSEASSTTSFKVASGVTVVLVSSRLPLWARLCDALGTSRVRIRRIQLVVLVVLALAITEGEHPL